MKFLDGINEYTIIVCSNRNKKIILKELNNYKKLIPIKFITLNELYNLLYFSYDEKSIYHLIKKYNIKYEVSKVYLDNLIYIDIDSNNYNNKKLDDLINIKNELDNNRLLIRDEYFIKYIENKNILFYGYDHLDKFMIKTINKLKEYTKVDIVYKDYNNYKHDVIEFNHIEEEVEYVASSICKLIKDGIDINNIKLTNIDDSYYSSIKRLFGIYNIPIELDDSPYINSTLPGEEFINNYNEGLNKTIELLRNKYGGDILNQIINIVNKYTFERNKLLVKDMIIHDLANTKIHSKSLENSIKIIDYNEIVNDSEYVFMMNFNQGRIPKIIKDEEYLTNKDKQLLGLDTNIELSKMIKESTINNIRSIKNLVITYKKESYTDTFFKSNLIDEMNLNVIKKEIDLSYSNLANKIKLCKDLDKYYKYNIKSEELYKLNSNYDIPYRKYNNRFNGINEESLNKLIKNKIVLSYSSMQLYNECAFKYYINNILKLDSFESTFASFIGTLFHHVLEVGIKKDISVKDEINSFIVDYDLSNKEKFFVDKLINDIEFALSAIKDNMKFTKFDNIVTENKFEVIKSDNVTIIFKGFIDKMMSYNNGVKTYVALIDYKTYDTNIKMDLIDYGLNIQLPIYLYLANSNIKDIEFAGFYVQKVLSNEIKYDMNESLNDQKKNSMKLVGYSNSNENILELFDSSYKDSNVINGLKVKKDGEFSSSSNLLSTSEMNNLINKVDISINKCIENIKKCKFDINPKNYKDNNISCKYCKYKDLCYMTPKDMIDIIVEEGEDNA